MSEKWNLPDAKDWSLEAFQKENYEIFKSSSGHPKVMIVKESTIHQYPNGEPEEWKPWYKAGEVFEIDERFSRERTDIFYSWNYLVWIDGMLWGIDRDDCKLIESEKPNELRCSTCNKLLAKLENGVYTFKNSNVTIPVESYIICTGISYDRDNKKRVCNTTNWVTNL